MNKYGRRHGTGNTSKGIYWILILGGVALIAYKVVNMVRNVKQLQEIEKEEIKNKNSPSYIIVIDSLGKKDTQMILDPLDNYDPATDTIKKQR